jgi:4-carboxymuconolactone decarboxylase
MAQRLHSLAATHEETAMAAPKSPPTTIGAVKDIVPKLADLTEKVLFGDVWARPGLSKRDRSFATVAALVALHRPDQLKGHIWRALDNGVTREELSELFTHLAFYAGWANGISAAQVAKQVYEERGA